MSELWYEIVLGDVSREFCLDPDVVMKRGYYEINRLWLILDELKARDLSHLALALDNPHLKEEGRINFHAWVSQRQPRIMRRSALIAASEDEVARIIELFGDN